MSSSWDFSASRDPNRSIVTFSSNVEVSTSALSVLGEFLSAALDTKPRTFDRAVHITSIDDSVHSATSWHYVGRAFDVRTIGVRHGAIIVEGLETPGADEAAAQIYADRQKALARWWVERLRRRLPGWQVMLENDHIHAEKDPS